jgi:hypothetical protein
MVHFNNSICKRCSKLNILMFFAKGHEFFHHSMPKVILSTQLSSHYIIVQIYDNDELSVTSIIFYNCNILSLKVIVSYIE